MLVQEGVPVAATAAEVSSVLVIVPEPKAVPAAVALVPEEAEVGLAVVEEIAVVLIPHLKPRKARGACPRLRRHMN